VDESWHHTHTSDALPGASAERARTHRRPPPPPSKMCVLREHDKARAPSAQQPHTFKSRCRIVGRWLCRCTMPFAASSAMRSRRCHVRRPAMAASLLACVFGVCFVGVCVCVWGGGGAARASVCVVVSVARWRSSRVDARSSHHARTHTCCTHATAQSGQNTHNTHTHTQHAHTRNTCNTHNTHTHTHLPCAARHRVTAGGNTR
jgi:hypothetical protein